MLHLKKWSGLASMLFIAAMILSSCSSDSDDDSGTIPPPNGGGTTLLRADLSVEPGTITEGENAIVTLTLDAPNNTGSDLVFDFTFGGTIDPESDVLSLVSTELVIANGATEVTLEIVSIDDMETEDTETFTLNISDGIPSGATAGTTTDITLNIMDND